MTYTFNEEVVRGSALPHLVGCLFRQICGFQVIEQYRTGTRSIIDGAKIVVDGYIEPCKAYPKGLMYEVKQQDVSGSAHKRIPYHVIDALQGAYPSPLLFIVDGDFFAKHKAGISTIEWLKGQIDGDYIMGVLNAQEFVTWCQRNKGVWKP